MFPLELTGRFFGFYTKTIFQPRLNYRLKMLDSLGNPMEDNSGDNRFVSFQNILFDSFFVSTRRIYLICQKCKDFK